MLRARHCMLVAGQDFAACRRKVERFFDRTILVKYDRIEVLAEESMAGDDSRFWPTVEDAVVAVSKVIEELVAELSAAGYSSLADLCRMEQGYESKILHTATHLLDGFFGIDSRFYNLEEDSHAVSDRYRRQIEANPAGHWLIAAHGISELDNADRVSFLRATGHE